MTQTYDADSIQILEGLEAVRKRPAMYIGSTGIDGLHQLAYEVVDNSVDEALAGHCDTITVTIMKDNWLEVIDNGRGIPVGIHKDKKKSALEVVLTILHAGGKFDNESYKVSGGLHGVGVSVVNALSEKMSVEVHQDGKIYEQHYTTGKPKADVKQTGTTKKRGTRVLFLPDSKIFETIEFNFDILSKRLRELAFLNAGLKIILRDERAKLREHVFQFKGGITEFIQFLIEKKTSISKKVIFFHAEREKVDIEIAIEYVDSYNETVFTYVNNINTKEGGTHLSGFKSALTRVLNDFLKKEGLDKKLPNPLTGDDVREGLVAIVSVKIPNPQFEGQTKMKLGNSEVKGIVESATNENLSQYFDENPQVVKRILEKCILSASARIAAKKARDLTRRKNALDNDKLPGTLADCSDNDPEKCELFIVEGESAGGSAKMGRDRRFQAILPLKGKPLNVEKSRLDKVLSSVQITNMITVINTGIGEDFDIKKTGYHKIIIMTDADVDGSHIATLLLTFFYRHMPEIINSGYLYIAQPPLYLLKSGKESVYVYSDEEKDKFVKAHKDDKIAIQRYKGLGEMNPDQLWETTMDPERRTILQVRVDDDVEADEIFTILMGDVVEPRRKFIEENASTVQNLDLIG